MGSDAAGCRPGAWRFGLVTTWLGSLTGEVRRGTQLPEGSRLHDTASYDPPVEDEHRFQIVDALEAVAVDVGKSVPQVALNWLTTRPTVSSVIIGAHNEEQLRQNLDAVGWTLSAEQIAKLNEASAVNAPYPHFPYPRQAFPLSSAGGIRANQPAIGWLGWDPDTAGIVRAVVGDALDHLEQLLIRYGHRRGS